MSQPGAVPFGSKVRRSIRAAIAYATIGTWALPGHVATLSAQGWSVDVSAGRQVYEPLAVSVDTGNLLGGVRYDSPRDTWVYGAAALPFGDDGTMWGAVGLGGRLMRTSPADPRTAIGADVGAHGFFFRDGIVNLTGTGGTLEAMPFVRVALGDGFIEGGGGWRGHTLSFSGVRENRAVIETGVRGGYGLALRIEGDARWVHADEGTFPFVGTAVSYQAARAGVWGEIGKWLAADLGEHVWAFGADVTVRPGTTVWSSIRRDAPDPLYWNSTRRTWSVGLTQRLGAAAAAPLLPLPRSPAGVVVVRLAAANAPAGGVSIAGDFNNWQAVPMQREGGEWIARLPLRAGVYHYAFRSATGEWFVPPSTPGRRDDGFGGYHALLVVG